MRKVFLPLTIVLLCPFVQQASAQNSSPYWSLAGNSNATTSAKLGTTTAVDLRLYAKNLERMRILNANGYVGIGTTAPGSQLQVNSASGVSPFKVQINGLTKLYISSGGGLSVGSGTSAPSNGLYVSGNVGIGTASPASSYKLDVEGGSSNGIYANSTGNYGVFGNSTLIGVDGQGVSGGMYGYGSGSGSYGVYGYGDANGVYGNCYNNSGGAGVYGTGVYGVQGSGTAFGIYGNSSNSTGTGVYGAGDAGVNGVGGNYGVIGSGVTYGVYGTSTGGSGTYAGYFQGNVYSTGTYQGSDRKLKKNITDFTSAMDIIGKLQPKSYEYRQDGSYKLMKLPEGKHYGLIAQDIEQVLPNLVKDTKFDTHLAQVPTKQEPGKPKLASATAQPSETIDFKAVNYVELIPIIIKGMQEQQQLIQEQQHEIAELKRLIEKIAPGEIKNLLLGSLGQNTPNPVSNSTRIQYNIPSNSTTAQLLVTDNAGRTVRAIQVTSSGFINLNTSGLGSGTYNYSLIIDGKIVETKNMIVIKN